MSRPRRFNPRAELTSDVATGTTRMRRHLRSLTLVALVACSGGSGTTPIDAAADGGLALDAATDAGPTVVDTGSVAVQTSPR